MAYSICLSRFCIGNSHEAVRQTGVPRRVRYVLHIGFLNFAQAGVTLDKGFRCEMQVGRSQESRPHMLALYVERGCVETVSAPTDVAYEVSLNACSMFCTKCDVWS